jgi:hypothetical protein
MSSTISHFSLSVTSIFYVSVSESLFLVSVMWSDSWTLPTIPSYESHNSCSSLLSFRSSWIIFLCHSVNYEVFHLKKHKSTIQIIALGNCTNKITAAVYIHVNIKLSENLPWLDLKNVTRKGVGDSILRRICSLLLHWLKCKWKPKVIGNIVVSLGQEITVSVKNKTNVSLN